MAIINGTAGNNTLNGTAGADTINGFAGNDRITGDEGNDLARMGAGNDTFIWHVGDGSDTLRGQDGFDTLVFECSGILEGLTISRDASRVRLSHTFGTIHDLDDVERIYAQALAGIDTIAINNLAGTDVTQVLVDLGSVPGVGSGGDGEVDTVARNGGGGNDTINLALVSGNVSVTGPSAAVTVRNADATDILEIAGLGGNDTINASKLPAGIMRLTLDGGSGNDTIAGSQGNDLLLGDSGNDVVGGGAGNDFVDVGSGNDRVTGGRGNDTVNLGAGNDLFAWSVGDGKDTVNGGDGIDTLQITGARGSDFLEIEGFTGLLDVVTFGNVAISADDVERIKVRALAGIDTIEVDNPWGAGVSAVDIDLAATVSGTLPDADPDTVRVFGTLSDDVVEVTWSGNKIVVAGLATDVSIAHAGVNDQLAILGSLGNDVLDASTLPAGKISLQFEVVDSDTIFGSAGRDVVIGAIGTKAIVDLGDGNDLFLGTSGDDVAHMGAGNDVFNASVGNDVGFLGSGNDTMNGGRGNDVANLGSGNDRYNYWDRLDGDDTIIGGSGIDTFDYRDESGTSDTTVFVAESAQALIARSSLGPISLIGVERARVVVGVGDDTIRVEDLTGTDLKLVAIDLAAASGIVFGDGWVDTVDLKGTAGNDLVTIGKITGGFSVTGLAAQVTVTHADASDKLLVSVGEGNDTIDASAMPNVLDTKFDTGSGNDRFLGGAGRDVVLGGDGNDTLSGGAQYDILEGAAGNDRLIGGATGDELYGGLDNDFLDGGIGSDLLDGGSGNDILIGGRGNDTISGGAGADRVRYTSTLDGHDVILDFDGDPAGGQDVLNLDALFDSLGIAASKRAGLVDISDIGNEVLVSVNADGKAGFELVIATLNTLDVITKGQDVIVGTL
jgi:Ca2+-binding RTX toxin-like protein